jgi:peptidyl-prolyl cis-trans isomerase C
MGLFDGIMKAFGNEQFAGPAEGVKATARHILLKTKDEATMVMDKIAQGGSFASMASQYSTCPSKNQGGSLGSFRPGVMVPAFDKVIFDPETKLNEVVGPVMTPVGALRIF